MKYRIPQLKLGATSFLKQDYYVPAVRFAASVCDDIALLVSEPGEKGEYLITKQEVAEIARIADGEGVVFNIHLPTDAHFETEKSRRRIVEEIRMAADRVGCLQPHSWVLHIEYPSLTEKYIYADRESHERTAVALAEIASFLPSPEYLAIENIETFPIDFWDKWLEQTPYSRCFDIGHVWKEGLNPEDYWPEWSPRIRMCHLHGLGTRDHQSLKYMSHDRLDAIMHRLWEDRFDGAVTMEVFNFDDFRTSHEALLLSYERYIKKKELSPD